MGTRHRGTEAEIASLDAYIKLMRAAESVTARLSARLPSDLTLSQFGVLETLLHCGPLCQGQLAAKLLKSGGNLTLVVDNLEKAGHVVRTRDPHDRRFVTVSLSPSGRALIAGLFPTIAQAITEEFSVLDPCEQQQLGSLCKRIGRPGLARAELGDRASASQTLPVEAE
ncbi:MAG: MarR family transcriptional regulator [Opitutaceae bacterium]|nr:MarR family transcriptional regulator [Opitutaceae bacterium]